MIEIMWFKYFIETSLITSKAAYAFGFKFIELNFSSPVSFKITT